MINQEVGDFGRVIIKRLKLWRFLFFVSVGLNVCLVVALSKAGLLWVFGGVEGVTNCLIVAYAKTR